MCANKIDFSLLMKEAQSGNVNSYTRLLKSIIPIINTWVKKQVFIDSSVEDVIQDVLLTVHRVRHTYDPKCPFLPWLKAITSARCIDMLRRYGRTASFEDIEQAELLPIDFREGYKGDDTLELNQLLKSLSLRHREVVECIHLKEMSLADFAKLKGLNVSAVKSLLHRAISKLRKNV